MIAFLDSSVILRRVLGQARQLDSWESIDLTVVNPLVEIECLRTLDRMRHGGLLNEDSVVAAREAAFSILRSCEVVYLGPLILDRAGQTLPVPLKTLDAVHLVSALLYRDSTGKPLVMATHDRALARASRAMGLEVVGAA